MTTVPTQESEQKLQQYHADNRMKAAVTTLASASTLASALLTNTGAPANNAASITKVVASTWLLLETLYAHCLSRT